MAPSGGHAARADRAGRRDRGAGGQSEVLDWSDCELTDELLEQRVGSELPGVLQRLRPEDGAAECAVNLAGNELSGRVPLGQLLRQFREAEVRVTCLRLHRNHLKDEALGALIEHIEAVADGGQPLAELHLSDNHLTEAGIRALIQAAFRGHSVHRGRALWLRAENQKPAIANPRAVLDSLAAEGMSVCLLPSKEFHLPGKGRPEVPVHLHHAFVPKTDQRWNAGLWMQGKGQSTQEGGHSAGASGSGGGAKAGGKGDWRGEQGLGKDRGSKGRWQAPPPQAPPQPPPPLHGGKGGYDRGPRARAAEQWRSPVSRWRPGPRERAAGGDWGPRPGEAWEAEAWEEWPEEEFPEPRGRRRAEEEWHEEPKGRRRHEAEEWNEEPKGRRRHEAEAGRESAACSFRVLPVSSLKQEWHEEPKGRRRHEAEDHLQGYGPQNGWEHRGCRGRSEQWGSGGPAVEDYVGAGAPPAPPPPPAPAWRSSGQCAASSGSGGLWLARAAESVRCKLDACKTLGVLMRSLQPSSVSDAEWMRIARLGRDHLVHQCTQRASVFVGSFMEEHDALHELVYSCAGEVGLASAFRELRLSRLYPSSRDDEQDDNQCASLVVAIFGELLDVPQQGESEMRCNARKVAEWALLDAVFLLGSARLLGAPGAAAPRQAPYAPGGPGVACY